MTSGNKANQVLGEYFTDAGLLNLNDLREASNIARNQNLPIGKVLVMSGYLSKETLQATIEMQARVKDGNLDYKIALSALILINKENITLEEALSRLNQENTVITTSNRLGEFLLGACLVSNSDLDAAKMESNRCGLPLGRVLVNLSMISEPVLKHALTLQSLVRNDKITKEDAIKTLIAAKDKQIENKLSASKIRMSPAKPQTSSNGPTVALSALSLHHILLAAGLVDTVSLEKAIQDSLEDAEIMAAILKRGGLLEDFVIEAAKECCQLIKLGRLKPEQAIMALHQCQRTRNSLHDCLLEFGWLQSRQTVGS